jgi:peroxiredoxin
MGMKLMDKAPDFVLPDHRGKKFRLEDLRGKKVLPSFHPLAWTPVCAKQMLSLEKNYDRFLELNTIPVGISVDPVPSKKAWTKDLGIEKLILLSDFWPHGEVAKKYGLFREKEGFSERANVVVDENGRVVFMKVYEISTLPDIEEILRFLKNQID